MKKQVVPVVLTKKLVQIKENNRPLLRALHPQPSLFPFFVGRRKELKQLRKMELEFGSTVISQYGGAGKTQLMVALQTRQSAMGLYLEASTGFLQMVELLRFHVTWPNSPKE